MEAGIHFGKSILAAPRQALCTQSGDFCQWQSAQYRAGCAALDDGADIVTIGRGALANPDLPRRLSDRGMLNDFDPTILGPIANIKETELVM